MYSKALVHIYWAVGISGHMSLWYPGPLGGAKKANAMSTYVNRELNFPLGCCDKDGQATLPNPGVCRGHLDLFDKQEPQVVRQAGQDAYFQLSDHTYTAGAPGSTPYGGSCQVGFSLDRTNIFTAFEQNEPLLNNLQCCVACHEHISLYSLPMKHFLCR